MHGSREIERNLYRLGDLVSPWLFDNSRDSNSSMPRSSKGWATKLSQDSFTLLLVFLVVQPFPEFCDERSNRQRHECFSC